MPCSSRVVVGANGFAMHLLRQMPDIYSRLEGRIETFNTYDVFMNDEDFRGWQERLAAVTSGSHVIVDNGANLMGSSCNVGIMLD